MSEYTIKRVSGTTYFGTNTVDISDGNWLINGVAPSVTQTTIPQITTASSYTFVSGDAGKHLYYTTSTTATITIPANSSVAYATGTILNIVSGSGAGQLTISCSDTLLFANQGFTGTRYLSAPGIATALKVASTTWLISGAGLS